MNDSQRRARSMKEVAELARRVSPPESVFASVRNFQPLPTDVIISPFAKCGTTWLQQTFHCLRTKGDMDFDDISRVVPWIESAGALGLDLSAPQRGQPRGFKSHLAYEFIPKGARYVVCFRDPKDALLSHYRFLEGWWFEPGSISIADFVTSKLAERGQRRDYWHHLVSWWERRDEPNVLLFTYEHMSAAPALHIKSLAAFCGIPLDESLLALTLEHSSLAFMLKHKDRFDDKLMRELSEQSGGVPAGSDSAKVRKGEVGAASREMTIDIRALLDKAWCESITPKFGFPDYSSFAAELRAKLK